MKLGAYKSGLLAIIAVDIDQNETRQAVIFVFIAEIRGR